VDLAISILEECKQTTPNPDNNTVVHLLNSVLGLPRLLPPNPLIHLALAQVLCTNQNERSDEAFSPSSEMIDECAVHLSIILTFIFTNNVVGVLERSDGRADVEKAIGLFRHGLGLLPIDHPFRLSAFCMVADALYTLFEQSGEREDLEDVIVLHEMRSSASQQTIQNDSPPLTTSVTC
jgi:hypothetical protein